MRIQLTLLALITYSIINAQDPKVDELWKLYMSGKIEQTIDKTNEYLITDSNNLDYNLLLGRALTDKSEYKTAIPYLKFVSDKGQGWRKGWALGYIGCCYYMQFDYEKSESALTNCINLNATKNATNYAYKRKLIFGYDDFFNDWKIKESEHIRFHFQNMSDEDIKTYMASREKAFVKINKFFNNSMPKKIDFFVWQSRGDAKKILRTNLGFARAEYCIIHSYFRQTKGHELTHVISNYSYQNIKTSGLINEGTAVCFDLSSRNKEELVIKWLKENNQKIDINDIWINWEKYPDGLSYPLAGLFVKEIINRFGQEKFLTFFKLQTYENATSVFGNDLDLLIEEFENKYNG